MAMSFFYWEKDLAFQFLTATFPFSQLNIISPSAALIYTHPNQYFFKLNRMVVIQLLLKTLMSWTCVTVTMKDWTHAVLFLYR